MSRLDARINRRSVLRGAGAVLALPFLDAMAPLRAIAGDASSRPPLRMGIVSVTGGTVIESWKPPETGALPARLPSILRSLEFARDDLLVLSGLSNVGRSENLNGHEACAFVHLTGAPVVKRVGGRVAASISVDQVVAQQVGDQTYLPSLEIGTTNHETRYSFRGPESPVPYEANPRLVYERMFRGRKPVAPNWQRRNAALIEFLRTSSKPDSREQSVVDLVLEEANSLRGTVGSADRQKLDEYLFSVRSVEKRIAFNEFRQQQELLEAEADKSLSEKLASPALPADQQAWHKLHHGIFHDPDRHLDYLRIMSDLMILALQTDTTRMITFAVGDDGAEFPGVVTVGQEYHAHTLAHQGNAGRPDALDMIAREACRQIHTWYTEVFAEMLGKMRKIDEGGSSLLDNCMIMYTSYMANGWHSTRDMPVLLAGKAGGRLKTGRHVAYTQDTPMANLYVEMLNKMGVPANQFGDSQISPNARYDGRLPDLA